MKKLILAKLKPYSLAGNVLSTGRTPTLPKKLRDGIFTSSHSDVDGCFQKTSTTSVYPKVGPKGLAFFLKFMK